MEDPAKYAKLEKDPRDRIRSDVHRMIDTYVEAGLLSLQDRLYLTGKTEKGGYSHDPSYKCSSPYIYPLYKLHKLSAEAIINKTIPPIRMVTSGTNGPTYRIGVFLDSILKPIAELFCEGELVKDTVDFLGKIKPLSDTDIFSFSHRNPCL